MKRLTIFISSVQKEFADERRFLFEFINGDALLRRFFDVFMFENLPAIDRKTDEVYLNEVKHCDIYLSLFGEQYGWEDNEGVSATHREFEEATKLCKPRLVFIKGGDSVARHPKMEELISKAGEQLVRRRFSSQPELNAAVYAALVQYLEYTGLIRTGPFDASACSNTTLGDISDEKVRWFLSRARNTREYALHEDTSVSDTLKHLNLIDREIPSHAAILLFGKSPQRFLITSEVKCMHFHGTVVQKPIPSYQIYKGTVFDMVDQSVDFVMSKLTRSVGTRNH
ncbi:DUF4062 domain-containing protein [uncultured Methanolobus sp.]|uniref:DUF4062 domain-containing protein n=1 Tax=uncultured Methanolobus sp. TaxID=218300 RepID=UPI0029C83288|nr:DUF4062 domain-containing protein [uncultured Methanolobus sp.]